MRLTPSGLWFMGRRVPVTIGASGLTRHKAEGDRATPIGTHRVVGMYYRPDRLPPPAPWARMIGPGDLWCDAPDHPRYNHLVRAPFAASHETMRRADPMYDIVLVTDWNYPNAQPHRGSAIFLHQWRRRGAATAGCLAFARSDLLWICRRIRPGTRVVIPALAGATTA